MPQPHPVRLHVHAEVHPEARRQPRQHRQRRLEHTYLQLARQLRDVIARGDITGRMPSLMELTEATKLAPNTVRRAIKVLADEGLVVTEPGRGTFVAEQA
jgi:GntR family transcriptional regulator